MRRVEAMAVGVLAGISATSSEYSRAEEFAQQAERIAPDDPGVLTTTWGETRVTAAIFGNDLPRALDAVARGIAFARTGRLTAPILVWGYWPLLRTISGDDGAEAIAEAMEAGAEVAFWNRSCLAYAQAILAGRDGRLDLAEIFAERGRRLFARSAPWWNHMMHRLVAADALPAGWGGPGGRTRDRIGTRQSARPERLPPAYPAELAPLGELEQR